MIAGLSRSQDHKAYKWVVTLFFLFSLHTLSIYLLMSGKRRLKFSWQVLLPLNYALIAQPWLFIASSFPLLIVG